MAVSDLNYAPRDLKYCENRLASCSTYFVLEEARNLFGAGACVAQYK